VARQKGDHFYKKAKETGFAARSVFKLEEIDQKHALYRNGGKVLDLGCSPGSWMQYAASKVGPEGRVLGVDLAEITVGAPNSIFHQMDIFDLRIDEDPIKDLVPFDFVQSDAMTKTTGIPAVDCAASIGLVEYALYLSGKGALRPGGRLLAKVFEGPGYQEFLKDFRKAFKKTEIVKPKATRTRSREVYLLGLGFLC